MKKLLIAGLLAIGGCASTAQDTRSTEPYRFTSAQPAAAVARCLITNAENTSGLFQGFSAEKIGMIEVTIRHPEAGHSIIAEVVQTAGGTSVTLWLSAQHFIGRDSLVNAIRKGC